MHVLQTQFQLRLVQYHKVSLCDFYLGVDGLFISQLTRRCQSTQNTPVLPDCAPILTYNNSDLEKLDILTENKGKSGIYRWVNKESSKSYVGSSTNLTRRFSQYFSITYLNKEGSMAINKALLKYGYSGFQLEILEYCEASKCLEREQYFIDLLKPEYNILKTAGSSLGRLHSEEAKNKISEARLGIKLSEETKKRMSEAQTGDKNPFYGKTHSDETIKKLSGSLKGILLGRPRPEGAGSPSQPIEVLDLSTGIKTVYSSVSEAARALGIKQPSITMYISKNTQKPYKGRYKFSKV